MMRRVINKFKFIFFFLFSTIPVVDALAICVDSFQISLPRALKSDSNFVGTWAGKYLDINEGIRDFTIIIDSCISESCYGRYVLSTLPPHEFRGMRKGSLLWGRFEYEFKFDFKLECVRIGSGTRTEATFGWALKGELKEILGLGYLSGPIVLWRKE